MTVGPITALLDKARRTKNKRAVLNKMLADRGVPYEVEYRWNYHGRPGWYLLDGTNQRIGHEFFGATELISHGTLDFLAKKK
jgi:hypothetical protein